MNRAKKKGTGPPSSFSARIGDFLERHSGRIILIAGTITLLLIVPLLTMGNDEQASQGPTGEAFDLRDDINERFAPRVHGWIYIAESRTGGILTQAALWELYQAFAIKANRALPGNVQPS